MSTGGPPVQLYGPLYGSLYFSAVLSTALYGVTCMQTFFYYVHYQNDLLRMKLFVAALWALNTIHEALVIAGVWKYILTGLMNPSLYQNLPPELIIQMLMMTVVAINSQGFFVYRIYVFSRKNLVAPLVWVILAIIQLVVAFTYVAKVYSANGIQVVQYTVLGDSTLLNLLTLHLSVASGVDILISIFLTFLLVRKRIATGFASTAHILQRLTVFAVNTGIWTALFALLTIITFHAFPAYMIYVVFDLTLCPVYCNTVLANLNARAYVRGEVLPHNIDTDLFTSPSSPPSNSGTKTGKQGEEVKTVSFSPQGTWKATEVVVFPGAERSTASGDL